MVPPSVRAVVLDVGGVFFLPSPHHFRPALSAVGIESRPEDAVWHRAHYVATAALDRAGMAGAARPERWDAYLAAFAAEVVPGGMEAADFAPFWLGPSLDRWRWIQAPAVDALRRLVGAGWPVAVVSNSDGTVEAALRERGVCQVGPGSGARVLHVVDSHLVGVEKPDPAVFEPALAALAADGIAREHCIYLGDTYVADVVGARAAGLHPVQIDPYGLYADLDHDRVVSVDELVDALLALR